MLFNAALELSQFVLIQVWQVWPYFLLSIFLAVLVEQTNLTEVIRDTFNRRQSSSILLMAGISAFSPFCSWTTIPLVRGFLLGGIPLAPIMVFWIASPTMDPEIFVLSVAILGWPLAIVRLIAMLILSLGAGYLTLLLTTRGMIPGTVLREQLEDTSSTINASCASGSSMQTDMTNVQINPTAPSQYGKPKTQGILAFIVSEWRQLNWGKIFGEVFRLCWSLGRWLVLAFIIQAFIIWYIPQTSVESLLGKSNGAAVLLAALIGVPLYTSNVSALPIISGLLEQGMQPGAAIAFLIAGPVTALPSIMAVWSVVRHSVFSLYIAIGVLGAVILGMATNLIPL